MASDSSAQYIRKVQHLIETCMTFYMSKEECMEALAKHANIHPLVTSTVWKELEKENKELFEAYTKTRDQLVKHETDQLAETLHKIQLDSSHKNTKDAS